MSDGNRADDDRERVWPQPTDTESLYSLTERLLDRMERMYEPRQEFLLGTGVEGLDTVIQGLSPGSFGLVFGLPGSGKTSLAQQIVLNVTEANRYAKVFWVNHETLKLSFASRALSIESRIPTIQLNSSDLNSDEWPRLSQAIGRVVERHIFIQQRPSTKRLLQSIHRLRSLGWIDLIVIDGLGLAPGSQAAYARLLKALALLESVPILTTVTTADPDGWGGLEPYVGAVDMFIALERGFDQMIGFTVRSNRYGPTGSGFITLDPATGRITNPRP